MKCIQHIILNNGKDCEVLFNKYSEKEEGPTNLGS